MQLPYIGSCIIWEDIMTAALLKSNELPSPYGIQGQIYEQNNSILTDLDVSQLLCLLVTKQVECTSESDADCKSYKYDIAQRVKFIPDWDTLTLFIASCHLFYNFEVVSALFRMYNGRKMAWNMLINQIYRGFMLTWLVSKREIKLLNDCPKWLNVFSRKQLPAHNLITYTMQNTSQPATLYSIFLI